LCEWFLIREVADPEFRNHTLWSDAGTSKTNGRQDWSGANHALPLSIK